MDIEASNKEEDIDGKIMKADVSNSTASTISGSEKPPSYQDIITAQEDKTVTN